MNVTLEKVIGKSLIDSNFRSQLLEAPEKALQQLGWILNEVEMNKLTTGVARVKTTNSGSENVFYEVQGTWWNGKK